MHIRRILMSDFIRALIAAWRNPTKKSNMNPEVGQNEFKCCTVYTKEEFTMDCLPPEMLKIIFLHLDLSDLRSARLTCNAWCNLIDNLVGLGVVLDDRIQGNPAFVKNVIKKEVIIKSATKAGAKKALCNPRNSHVLEKMVLTGPVHCKLFIKEVMNYQNMTTLIVGVETLLQRLSLKQSMYLPMLERLVLNSAFHWETDYPVDVQHHQIAVAKNTRDFLSNIWCPNILELVLDGDVEQGKASPNHDWKYTALIEFLEKYRGSLRKLLIGESSVLKSQGLKMHDRLVTNLQQLHLTFFGNDIDGDSNFWAVFISSQKQIENLNVGALWYNRTQEFFANLPSSIQNLTLYWNMSEYQSLSCAFFGSLVNLQRLELTYDGIWGQHLARFPLMKGCKNLKVLVLEQLLISARELEGIPGYLPKLEILYLYSCGDPLGRLRCADAPFGITEMALNRILWNMDELVYLHICSDDFLGDDETIKVMNQQISKVANATRKGCKGQKSNQYYVGREPDWLVENFDDNRIER